MPKTSSAPVLAATLLGVALAGCSASAPVASGGPSATSAPSPSAGASTSTPAATRPTTGTPAAASAVVASSPAAEPSGVPASSAPATAVTGRPSPPPTTSPPATGSPATARPTRTRRPSPGSTAARPSATDGVPAEVAAAVRRLRPVHPQGADITIPWEVDDVSQYDPSASISAVVVRAAYTGSGWVQVLLFHGGRYLGRATSRPVESAELFIDDAPPDTVGVHYQWEPGPGASNADPDYQHEAIIGFRWNGSRVVMQGTLPDAAFL